MDRLLLPPSDSVVKRIKEQLNETDSEKMEHHLKLFEKWIQCQPHLPKNYEKGMLKTFLRGTKHDLEAAKRKFEFYFVSKTAVPRIWHFQPFTKDEMKCVNNCILAPMPHLTDEGYRLVVISIRDPNLDFFDYSLTTKNTWRIGHLRGCKDTLFAGDIFICDCSNATPAHIPKLLTADFKYTLQLSQEGYPCRIKAIHIVNAPAYFDRVVSLVKMMVKEKLRNRIFVDRGISSIKQYSEKTIPKEYGGSGEYSHEVFAKWIQYIDDNKSWFEEQNEVKLIGPIPKNMSLSYDPDCDLGVQGSFRQLSID